MSPLRVTPRYRAVGSAGATARQFTDRREAFAAFRRVLDEQPPDDQRVLNFYGIGGIGKSRLQQELRAMLAREDLALSVRVDFQPPGMRRQDAVLSQLRHRLHVEHSIAMPAFDIAYAAYWQRTNPNLPLAAASLPLIGDSEILAELIDAAGETPIFGVVVNLLKGIDKLGRTARRWQRVRHDADLLNLDRLDTHELLDALDFFFARDLLQALQERHERCVIFLDAHEALWEDVSARGARGDRDAWIRDLVAQTPGVLWIVGSRDALSWSVADPDWREPYLTQIAIGDLSDVDRREFLESCGVTGEVGEAIARASRGVPFFLNVSVDHWERISLQRAPVAADFGHTQEDLLSRFIGHVPRAEEELLKVLSVAREWDQPLFETLVRRFNIAFPLTRWGDFCAQSFTRQTSGGSWVMHELMREELLRRLGDDLRGDVHAAIHDYEHSRADDCSLRLTERLQAFREAVFHGLAGNRLEADWFMRRADEFMLHGLWTPMQEITNEMATALDARPEGDGVLRGLLAYLEAWIMRQQGGLTDALTAYAALDLSLLRDWELGIRFQIAHAARESGQHALAETTYSELWARAPADHERVLHTLVGIQLADIDYVRGRFRDAWRILETIAELDPERCTKEVAEAKRILAHIERFSERKGRGVELYREAGRLFERCEDVFGRAIIETNLAEALWPHHPVWALEHARVAIERNQAVGARLEIGKARVAAAYAHLTLGSSAAALSEAEEALAIQEEVGYFSGRQQARLARAAALAVRGEHALAAAEAADVARCLGEQDAYPTLRLAAVRLVETLGSDELPALNALRERAQAEVQWLDDPATGQARLLGHVERLLTRNS